VQLLAQATAAVDTPPLSVVAVAPAAAAAAVPQPAMQGTNARSSSMQLQQPQQQSQQQRQHEQLLQQQQQQQQQQQVSVGPHNLLQLKAAVGAKRLLAVVQTALAEHKRVHAGQACSVVQLEAALSGCLQRYKHSQESDCVLGTELVTSALRTLHRCKARHFRGGDPEVLTAWSEELQRTAQEAAQTLRQVCTNCD
jgi:hypothetical protein